MFFLKTRADHMTGLRRSHAMAAHDDGHERPSKRRCVDAAVEALRENQVATHRLLGAIDDAERDLHLEEVVRAAEFLGELPNPFLDIPPRKKSD
jgi:hypothetical protein